MNRLDRYVGRIVLGAFAAATLFFVFLMVVVDLLTRLPGYLTKSDARGFELAWVLIDYYLGLLPVLFVTVTPFTTVIACMFSIARLQNANEVVPMLFVGRGIQRVLAPMLACGLLAGLLMIGCWQWVVPGVSATLAASQAELREGRDSLRGIVDEARGETERRLYAEEFDPRAHTLQGVAMLTEGALAADTSLVTASLATWDAERRDWALTGGRRSTRHEAGPVSWLERGDLTPDLLLQRSRDSIEPDALSYTELVEVIEQRPTRADLRLALHRHFTYPLANLVLLLLALPLGVRYERGSRIERLLLAIGLCGGYLMVDLICHSLGKRGEVLHPVVAAWAPTILFGSLGVVMFGSTRT